MWIHRPFLLPPDTGGIHLKSAAMLPTNGVEACPTLVPDNNTHFDGDDLAAKKLHWFSQSTTISMEDDCADLSKSAVSVRTSGRQAKGQ